MVLTKKFSEFTAITKSGVNQLVGLSAGDNAISDLPINWTIALRPVAPTNGFSGYNTDLSQWEYWNATIATWVQFAGGGAGTVTLVNTGVGLTGGSITTIGTIALDIPVTVPHGGTGVTSVSAYSLVCGGTTSSNPLQTVASVGTLGQVLTSNGPGALPTWQTTTGSGTVNIGSINQIAWYAATGTVVSGLATVANGVLITSAGSVPSISTSLPAAVQNNITALGTIASGVWQGTPVTVPYGGTGNTTFTAYSVICAGTTSTGVMQNVSGVGTAGQVLTSNGAAALPTWQAAPGATPAALTKTDDTNITLTLGGSPSTALLAATSLTLGWTGTLSGTRGGTGVNNGSSTFTMGGSVTFSGSFTFAGTITGNTAVTFPTSGTLATTAQIPSGAALTKVDDTNVTMTLGGSPSTALINAASMTLGWTGQLSSIRGGTGVNNGASTITVGGSFSMVGAFTFAGTLTGNTAVTFPTSGTLATTTDLGNYLPLAGGTMSGNIDMDGNNVSNVADFSLTDGTFVFSLSAAGLVQNTAYVVPTNYPAVNGYILSSTTAGVMSWVANTAGSMVSVVGTANQIDVDATDPQNPVVSLSSTMNLPGTFNIQTTTAVDSILDEDNMVSDSPTALATQQSIKAYVDAQVGGVSPLTIKGDLFGFSTVDDRLPVATGDGKILQVDSAAALGLSYSTPTYPSASGTSRKILVSDGTNNVYSTETYAVPGSSGNIMTSDGTNWTSAAPAAAASSVTNFIIGGNFNTNPWQRGTTFTSAGTTTYAADRFRYIKIGTGVVDYLKTADAPSFADCNMVVSNCLNIDVTTADGALSGTDTYYIDYGVEGYEWAQLAQKAFTLSFWHKHTKTGTYCVGFLNSNGDRTYVGEYIQTTTNTWEKATITVSASPSAGTWNYTNGVGLQIIFVIASGTATISADAWQSATPGAYVTANQVNGMDSTSNFFKLALVQLETGSTANDFASEPIETTLLKCQRYYRKSYNQGTDPATNTTVGSINYTSNSTVYASGTSIWTQSYTPMRTTPTTVTLYGTTGTSGVIRNITAGSNLAAAAANIGDSNFSVNISANIAANSKYGWHYTADAEVLP